MMRAVPNIDHTAQGCGENQNQKAAKMPVTSA
jgi:hypothetical protein